MPTALHLQEPELLVYASLLRQLCRAVPCHACRTSCFSSPRRWRRCRTAPGQAGSSSVSSALAPSSAKWTPPSCNWRCPRWVMSTTRRSRPSAGWRYPIFWPTHPSCRSSVGSARSWDERASILQATCCSSWPARSAALPPISSSCWHSGFCRALAALCWAPIVFPSWWRPCRRSPAAGRLAFTRPPRPSA